MFRISKLSLILLVGLIVGIQSKSEYQCVGKCPAENLDDDVVYLPHDDCTKFCVCKFETPLVLSCPDGLHFNPKLHVCDYPRDTGCEEDQLIPVVLSLSHSVQSEELYKSDDTAGCIGTCPVWEGDTVVHLAHKDCTKFCKCDFGEPHVFQCPSGLHFNPKLELCDRPSHAGCEDGKPSSPPPPPPSSSSSPPPSSSPSPPPSSSSPSPPPSSSSPSPPPSSSPSPPSSPVPDDDKGCVGTCPLWEDDDVIHLPHKNCTKFCKCDFGVPHVFQCPTGLHFNPKLGVCDRPSHAGCVQKNSMSIRPKSSDSEVHSSEKKSVLTDDTSGCIGNCPTWEGDEVVHLAHIDCTKFCKCDFGIAHVFQCPKGLHFNPRLDVCDRPSHAGCANKPIEYRNMKHNLAWNA